MGVIERNVRRRARKQNIQKAILSAVGIAGILAVGMAAPNALKLLDYTSLGRKSFPYRADESLKRLIARGDIVRKVVNGNQRLSLTPKGSLRLARLSGKDEPKRRRWDRRWRIVMFDIPERRRESRDLLRRTLVGMGFEKLQESVWIYPYDREDLITLLKTDRAIRKEVLYIVSEHVEGDSHLRRIFGLR